MFAVLLALGLVGGLVGYAAREAVAPSAKPVAELKKLVWLKSKLPRVTLDEAEDGAVLARRFGDKKAALMFHRIAVVLRKKRVPI